MAYRIVALLIVCILFKSCTKKDGSKIASNKPISVNTSGTHIWWHWLDGEITKEGITSDLESMKARGISQATILNVSLFKDKSFGNKKIRFGTDEWYEMFEWALKEADRLGLAIGVHNCDGWSSSGGPWINPSQSMKMFTWSKATLSGGEGKLRLQLSKPAHKLNYYKDIAVVAYPANESLSSFQLAKPTTLYNDTIIEPVLMDGQTNSTVKIKRGDEIIFKFNSGYSADKICFWPRKEFMWSNPADFEIDFAFQTSNDGKKYKDYKQFSIKGLNGKSEIDIQGASANYYKIIVKDFSKSDFWLPLTIAELELLKKGESPRYNPSIPNHEEKTGFVKASDDKAFNSKAETTQSGIPANKVIDISKYMKEDGTLEWDAPKGIWNIIRFGYTLTNAKNAPATKEGEGLECDKMDSTAVIHHFKSFPEKLIAHAGKYSGNTFKFLLVDSWECGFQNWTDKFSQEFEKRRGYSITSYIPALCGELVGNAEESETFLYDFRRTVADLIETNYYLPFKNLCHANKLEFHSEAIYGGTGYPSLDVMKSNSYSDLPMLEFWSGVNNIAMPEYNKVDKEDHNLVVSASFFYDKPVIGAEAFTGFANYSESPWSLKPFGDRAYCSGINQFILHSYVHQPVTRVGCMTLGEYGGHFNRNNLWFEHADSWIAYQTRVQSYLQKGDAYADVLYFIGDQYPQMVESKSLYDLQKGYKYHLCNRDILENKLIVKDGKIVYKNIGFSILVLPENLAIEYKTLEILEKLVQNGSALFGNKPVRMISGTVNAELQSKFKAMCDKLWGGNFNNGYKEYGKGKVYQSGTLNEILETMKVPKDFGTFPVKNDFLYTHRKSETEDIYFVFNQSDSVITRQLEFKTANTSITLLDPVSGLSSKIACYKKEGKILKLPTTFKPKESLLFIFSNSGNEEEKRIETVSKSGMVIFPNSEAISKELSFPSITYSSNGKIQYLGMGNYELKNNEGKQFNKKEKKAALWEIKNFDGLITFDTKGNGNIQDIKLKTLIPLTQMSIKDVKYFSGLATYKIKFSVPTDLYNAKDGIYLHLNSLAATCEVTLNGEKLGSFWTPEIKVAVKNQLKKDNILEVKIVNMYRNRIIGDFIQYGELKNVWTSTHIISTTPPEKFLNKNQPLIPFGLWGNFYFTQEVFESIE